MRWGWAFLLTLMLCGCAIFDNKETNAEQQLNLDMAIELSKKNLFEIHMRDLSTRLKYEHTNDALLLDIPSVIREWEYRSANLPEHIYSRGRATLETALTYMRALETQNGDEARQKVEPRQLELFEFDVVKVAAKYDSRLREKELLLTLKNSAILTKSLQEKLNKIEQDLDALSMELRILCGIKAGKDLEWKKIKRDLEVTPKNELLLQALSNRSEIANYKIPLKSVIELQEMLPPRTNKLGLNLYLDAEMMFRLPDSLAQRRLKEQVIEPEAIALLQSLAILNEVRADYKRYENMLKKYNDIKQQWQLNPEDIILQLEKEQTEMNLWIAIQRLKYDVGGKDFEQYVHSPKWQNSVHLALEICDKK